MNYVDLTKTLTFVLQTAHVPAMRALLLLSTRLASFISTFVLHFTQYPFILKI